MDKLLIADHSDFRVSMLSKALRDKWDVSTAFDGYAAVKMINKIQPDAMIINLNLSWLDGIAVLEQCFPKLPPVIIALSTHTPPYVRQTAESLGIGYICAMPFMISHVVTRLDTMLEAYHETPQYLTRHIRALDISPHRDGYRYLTEGVRLLHRNPHLRLQKELYCAIAEHCDAVSAQSVERAIRVAIQDAWNRRNQDIWEYYFPGAKCCPTNGEVIARLAGMI